MILKREKERVSSREAYRRAGTDPPPPIPATALAAISASIEGANPQQMVPAPVGSMQMLALHKLHGSVCDQPKSVKPNIIAPRRPRISDSRPISW